MFHTVAVPTHIRDSQERIFAHWVVYSFMDGFATINYIIVTHNIWHETVVLIKWEQCKSREKEDVTKEWK